MHTTTSTPATTGRIRRILLPALLTFTVFCGVLVGTATPAHAAAVIVGCFQTADGYPLAGYPVHLAYYIDNTWRYTRYTLDQTGCVTIWTTTTTQYHKMLIVNTGGFFGYYIGAGTWYGNSPMFKPGTQVEMGVYRVDYTCEGRVNVCR